MKQEKIFVDFMRDHVDLARGFSRGDKISQDNLWKTLIEELNCAGPPTKDLADWKKTWLDWKNNIKRKLSHNKREAHHTGGGNFNQYILSNLEEEIAVISGLYQTVDGIKNTKAFGKSVVSKPKTAEEDCESLFSLALSSEESSTSTATKTKATECEKNCPKERKTGSNLEKFMENESYQLKLIAEKIENLSKARSDESLHVANKLENIGNKLDSICFHLGKIAEKYDALIEIEQKKLLATNM